MRLFITGTAALLLLAACGRDADTADTAASAATATAATASSEDRATRAAAVATAIRAKPAAADSILQANGYTRESFEALMYEIAADEALSATYAAAHER